MVAIAVAIAAAAGACGGSPPPVRYYQIEFPEEDTGGGRGEAVLAVERLSTDAAYDDSRIVYRENAYRLDYYHYHRWSAPPGVMLSDYLRLAYDRTGEFGGVVGDFSDDVDAVLRGRVMAIEEVNETEEEWLARVRLDLQVRDARTGGRLWSRLITETEPVPSQDPEGLARAVAAAMARIVDETAAEIAAAISERE